MIEVYCIDGPLESQWHTTHYQDFRVMQRPLLDFCGPPIYERPDEITYKCHKWRQQMSRQLINYPQHLSFRQEVTIATCNPFGPTDLIPEEMAHKLRESVIDCQNLIEYGCFVNDFDQWFAERAWKHGLLTKEDLI